MNVLDEIKKSAEAIEATQYERVDMRRNRTMHEAGSPDSYCPLFQDTCAGDCELLVRKYGANRCAFSIMAGRLMDIEMHLEDIVDHLDGVAAPAVA